MELTVELVEVESSLDLWTLEGWKGAKRGLFLLWVQSVGK